MVFGAGTFLINGRLATKDQHGQVRGSRLAFSTLYLANLCDVLSFTVLLIILAPLIVSPAGHLLPVTVDEDTRNFIFGSLIAIYPLAQIVSAPVLGELSDRLGRRKMLLIALAGTGLSWLGVALAIRVGWIVLLFASRLLAGLFAACTSLSQAGVADLTTPQGRGRYMAIFAVIGGFGGIVGPYVASWLSDPSLVSWFNLTVPAMFVTLLYLASLVLVALGFKEPLVAGNKGSLSLAALFAGLLGIFRIRPLLTPFLVFALMGLGWFWFFSFFSAYLEERLHVGQDQISNLYAYLAVWLFIGGHLAHRLLHKFSARATLIIPQFFIGVSVIVVPTFTSIVHFWIMLAVAGICQSIASACLFTLMSNLVPEDMQGRLFGSLAAVLAITLTIASQLSGALADLWLGLPAFTGGVLLLAGALLYLVWYGRHKAGATVP